MAEIFILEEKISKNQSNMNQALAKILTKNLSYFLVGPFKSSSGTFVPLYLEFRNIYSDPQALKILAKELGKIVKRIKAQVIAGAEMAGIPAALATSLQTKIPFVYIKKERKKFLAQKCVEGVFKKGSQAVLIDDTLIYGLTKKRLIDNAQKDGLIIKDIIVIYKVGGKGHKKSREKDWFKKQGIKLHYLFTKEEILNFLISKNLIPEKTLAINQHYADDPVGWIKNKKYWQEFLVWRKECKKLDLL